MINEKDEPITEKSLDDLGKTIKKVRKIIKKSRTFDGEGNLMSKKLTDLVLIIKQMTKNKDEYLIASSLIPTDLVVWNNLQKWCLFFFPWILSHPCKFVVKNIIQFFKL